MLSLRLEHNTLNRSNKLPEFVYGKIRMQTASLQAFQLYDQNA